MSEPLHPEVAILNAVLELPAGQRAAYLDKACAGDAALRRQLEALLRADGQAGGFLDQRPTSLGFQPNALFNIPLTEKPGDKIGRYKLLQQIGEGGCGVVYMAEQEEPVRRRVALKVIKLGMDTKQVIARFEAERQALALMDHPNIAKVLDAGATETGRPYFVMELVRGIRITDFCDENNISTQERLKLFIPVCQAIQHAHQKGVIHRDIKPSNILVTINDGVPVPKVIDFGIAKATAGRLTDHTLFTAFEQFIGTPAYMSPEQAVMTSLDIDTRSDIYSLGVLLYELLTGRTPFDQKELLAAGLDEMRRTIREVEPVKPSKVVERESELRVERAKASGVTGSTLNSQLKSLSTDLDWIVMKCLEKDRTRRYETANGVAADLHRHLHNEPILARPPSGTYRFQKWVRRNRVTFGTGLAVAVAAVLALVILVVSNVRIGVARRAEQAERQKSDSANRELRQTVGSLELQRAEDFFRAGDAGVGVAHLAAMLRRDPSNHIAASRLMSALLHRNWALRAAPAMRHADAAETLCFSPDGRHVLSAGRDKTAKIWDAATGKTLTTIQHGDQVFGARYSADGTRIVTASADGTARIWSPIDGAALALPLCHQGKVYWAEFSRDGQHVVTASADKTACIWDGITGALKHKLEGDDTEVLRACFSPDGHQVATGAQSGCVRIWSVEAGRTIFRIDPRHGLVTALAISPDGKRLGAGYTDGVARLWSLRTFEAVGPPLVHKERVHHIAFSPDSRLFLTASQEGEARVWDAGSGAPSGLRFVHEGGVTLGEFNPDGKRAVTASMDNSVRVWEVATGLPFCQPIREREAFLQASLSPDGRRLATASPDGVVQIWDIQPRRFAGVATHLQNTVNSVAFSGDGNSLIATCGQAAHLLDAASGRTLASPLLHNAGVQFAEFSPDGKRVVTTTIDGNAFVWNWQTGQIVAGPLRHGKIIWRARFSPEGDRVATASADGTARVWDARSGQPTTPPLGHGEEVLSAQFSPNGRWIVTASEDHSARVWDARTGKPAGRPLLHNANVNWAVFSPDGERILTSSKDNTACIWDARTSQPVAPLLEHGRTVGPAFFSADGGRVVTASMDLTARVWDAGGGQALTPPMKHDKPVVYAQFSLEGRRILTSDWDGKARLWDSLGGLPLTEWLETGGHLGRIACCLDPASQRFAAAGFGGVVRAWDLLSVPIPVPDWLPDFAEAVAGIRLATRGNLEIVTGPEFDAVAEQLRLTKRVGVYERVARWFLDDPARRAPVPPMDAHDPPRSAPAGSGSAIRLDGVDDFITVPHAESLNALPVTFTVWIKTSQSFPAAVGVLTKHIPGLHDGFALFLWNGRAQTWYFRNETNRAWDGRWGSNRGFVADGQWHHLAFVADETGSTLYIDGSATPRQLWKGTPGATMTPTELVFGRFTRSWPGPPFAGLMNEVTLWNRALSQAEVKDLMKTKLTGKEDGLVGYWPFEEGSGAIAHDRTGHGHDGSLENGPAWVRADAPSDQ